MTAERTFVDTNILVYAYDADGGDMHELARSAIRSLWISGGGVLSTQVLQEFYVTVTRKISSPIPKSTAREIIGTYAAWPTHRPDVADVCAASDLEEAHHLSFWDALVVVSAHRTGASVLLTEDLSHGQIIRGVTVENPFVVLTG